MPTSFQGNIANLIVPEVFNPYFMEMTAEKVRVLAPMTTNDGAMSQRFRNSGGRYVHLPFFNDLDGDSDALAVGDAISVSRLTSSKDVARRQMRGKGWTVNDLESELTAEDPLAAIASRVASYWSREIQKYLFHALEGVFANNAATDSGDLIHDIEATDGELSRTELAIAKNKIGDSSNLLTYIAVHSTTYTNLQINDNIRDERDSDANLEFESFAGLRIIVDDNCPVEAGAGGSGNVTDIYTTYLFAPGAVAYADGMAKTPSEVDRDAELSEDRLFTRIHFMMHPRGHKWTESSVAGETPTPAELQDAANWERVYEKKNTRIVAIKHISPLS